MNTKAQHKRTAECTTPQFKYVGNFATLRSLHLFDFVRKFSVEQVPMMSYAEG
jgi:hypothetical protein